MNSPRKTIIKDIIKNSIETKLNSYNPETTKKPFHDLLLGRERMVIYSFIHSLNTTFGTSIYEQIAIALASKIFKKAEKQVKPPDEISSDAQQLIETIMNGLETGNKSPNKSQEIQDIREVCRSGTYVKVKLTQVDVWLENTEGDLFLFDLKTVKPNKGNFQDYKRTLLKWAAAILGRDPESIVNTMIGVPYNPYEPKPYNRWTAEKVLDMQQDILIADELWDFIGGEGTYLELLDAFEQVGIELKDEIDQYFEQFS